MYLLSIYWCLHYKYKVCSLSSQDENPIDISNWKYQLKIPIGPIGPIDQLATGKYMESETLSNWKPIGTNWTNWQLVQLKPVETNWNQNRIGPHWNQLGSMGTCRFLWDLYGNQFDFDFNWFQLVSPINSQLAWPID